MRATLILPFFLVLGQLIGEAASTKGFSETHCVNFSEADQQGEKFGRHSEEKQDSIPRLAKKLTSPFTNPILKARAIYTWLHHNIAFETDPNTYNGTRQSPEHIIGKEGAAVGKDYAKLFEELARAAGVEVMYISGHGKGPEKHGVPDYIPPPPGVLPPFQSTHAWNAVKKLDGSWQPIDPSYGAMVIIKPDTRYANWLDSKWFDSRPDVFRRTHYPEKPEHQFCSDVMSWKDYMREPEKTQGPYITQAFKDIGFDEVDLKPNIEVLPSGGPIRFVVKRLCKPPIKKEDRYLLIIDDGGDITPMTMEVDGRVWSATVTPVDSGPLSIDHLATFQGRDAKGLTLAEYEKGMNETKLGTKLLAIARYKVVNQDQETEEATTEDSSCIVKATLRSKCKAKTPNGTFRWDDKGNVCIDKECEKKQGHKATPPQSDDSDVLDFSCINYTEADAQGEKFPLEEYKSIRKLAKDLTSPFTSHALKARAIFTWITQHISYDIPAILQGTTGASNPEKVIRRGAARCGGFAKLFRRLATDAGLENMLVGGVTNDGYETVAHHAWNAVKLNGRWKIIDSTWGTLPKIVRDRSGVKFLSTWFTQSPEVFQRTHYPDDPDEQFRPDADVISNEESSLRIKKMDVGPSVIAGIADDGGLNLQEVKPNFKRITRGKRVRFEVKCRCGPIKPEEQYLPVIIWNRHPKSNHDNRDDVTPLKSGKDGCLWSTVLTPSQPGAVKLAFVTHLGAQNGKGLTMKEYEADAAKPEPLRRFKDLVKWEVE